MLLSRAHYPVTVLGWGSRAGIWFQGCRIHCAGCVSLDTWEPNPATSVDVDDVLAWVESFPAAEVDGITISGGEPFDQPEALEELLGGLERWRSACDAPVDILCYSGYPLTRIRARFPELLARLDVIVPEPFRRNREGAMLRGSDNQSVLALSDLGRERYDDEGPRDRDGRPRLQVDVDDSSIWYIGVPARGDMERLEVLMERRGVRQEQVSWRS